MEKKCKKAKWLSGEALQIAVKRREVKSKGEKERHKHLNADFQRIARRDKKAFFSDQCREIEENNRMGKTRDLFKSITTNKASGGDEIPVELLEILKDDAVKVLHSICQQNWKTEQWPQDWKSSVFIPISKKGNAKECSHYHTIALISHASKVMLKILQARLQQYVNRELPGVQAGFRKAEEPEIKLPTSARSWKMQESSRKTSISALLTMPKPWTVWTTVNCGKF